MISNQRRIGISISALIKDHTSTRTPFQATFEDDEDDCKRSKRVEVNALIPSFRCFAYQGRARSWSTVNCGINNDFSAKNALLPEKGSEMVETLSL